MVTRHEKIGPLKKILLTLCTGCTETSLSGMNNTRLMEFIFGLGMNGLTHVECMLEGKYIGDEIIFPVKKNDISHYFAHLHSLLPELSMDCDPVFFKIAIKDISKPTHREIVKSLAETASCGSDCGCGCGSH
jgi:hypothetical protein